MARSLYLFLNTAVLCCCKVKNWLFTVSIPPWCLKLQEVFSMCVYVCVCVCVCVLKNMRTSVLIRSLSKI